MMLRFVDLFSGIGGLRKGLEISLAGNNMIGECVFSSEIDAKAQETYRLNYGETPSGDIRQIDHLPDHDILLAGFPCQAFSFAGKKKGFGDTRGTLFFEIERLLSSLINKPVLLLLENVRGFASHDGGRTYATVKSRLEALGYHVKPLLLNSSIFGVPQSRVRIYFVCTLGGPASMSIESDLGAADSHKHKQHFHQGTFFSSNAKIRHVKDILEKVVDDKFSCTPTFTDQLKDALCGKNYEALHGVRLIDYRGGNSIHSWDLGTKGHCSSEERDFMNALIANRRKKKFGREQDGKMLTLEQIRTFWDKRGVENLLIGLEKKGYIRTSGGKINPTCGNMSFEVFKFLDPESISITVVSSDAHRLGIVQNGKPRRITPRECARLQGFPDDFILHPIDLWAYRQLGNSVSVPVVTAIVDDFLARNPEFFARRGSVRASSAKWGGGAKLLFMDGPGTVDSNG